ncbi:MAG: hypothetical protein HKN36_03745 [Hellea sp.]|nr:hypothetical protein [Hellea sp.]
MRNFLIGASAIALSGCTWLGGSDHHKQTYNNQTGYYAPQKAKVPCCGTQLSRWNMEVAIGPEFMVGGNALTGDQIIPQDGVIGNEVSMRDAFDTGVRYELGGSYALNPKQKLTLTGSFAEADGDRITLGTNNGVVVAGDMSDYQRLGVELGMRQYFTPQPVPVLNSVRPYVEGKIGASHIDDIALTNVTNNSVAANNAIALYDGGWVPTAAGMVGVETPIFNRTTVGLETGVRYTGKLSSDRSDLDANNVFAGSNNGSTSWTVPVMLRGRYRF